jgi:hypothetical protein
VVRRHDRHDGGRIFAVHCQGSHGNGGGGIARDRFENNCLGLNARSVQLLLHEESVIVVAEQKRIGKAGAGLEPAQRCPEKARSVPVE